MSSSARMAAPPVWWYDRKGPDRKGTGYWWAVRRDPSGEQIGEAFNAANEAELLQQITYFEDGQFDAVPRQIFKTAAPPTKMVWSRPITKHPNVLNKINGVGEKYQYQAHEFNIPPAWVDEFLSRPVYVIKDKHGTDELAPGNRIGLMGSLEVGPEGRETTRTDRGVRHKHKIRGPGFIFINATIQLGPSQDDLITMFPLHDRAEAVGQQRWALDPAKVQEFLQKGYQKAAFAVYTTGEEGSDAQG